MQPMGFWESIVFIACCSLVYAVVGVWVALFPEIETTNTVKLTIIGVFWPLAVVYGLCVLVKRASARLLRDARELMPKAKTIKPPPRVTVEMLAGDHGIEYKPGQWQA